MEIQRLCSLVFVLLLASSTALGSATRAVDGDALTSSDHSKTFTLPSSTTTLIGTTDTATLTNKTIDCSSNTCSKLPVSNQMVRDTGYGNSSTTAFTLSFAPPSTTGVQVFLDGLQRTLTSDYTISSTTLTFTTAPATGQIITVVYSRY